MLTPYEQQQLDRIRRWQSQAPGWGARLMAKPGGRIAQAVQAVVPDSALRAALEGANALADRLSSERSILERAEAQTLSELRARPLPVCDGLARRERRRAMAMAAGGGAVFALASANNAEEKQSALNALRTPEVAEALALREGLERVAERELAKEAASFSLQTLASRIGVNLGQRKAVGAVPVLGMAIGATVNAGYLHDVAQAAQFVFQERWLRAKYPALLRE